jgi:hypothetical protein
MAFFMCILQYILEMIVLVAVGLLGGCVGIKLRKRKDAKASAEPAVTTKE